MAERAAKFDDKEYVAPQLQSWRTLGLPFDVSQARCSCRCQTENYIEALR